MLDVKKTSCMETLSDRDFCFSDGYLRVQMQTQCCRNLDQYFITHVRFFFLFFDLEPRVG